MRWGIVLYRGRLKLSDFSIPQNIGQTKPCKVYNRSRDNIQPPGEQLRAGLLNVKYQYKVYGILPAMGSDLKSGRPGYFMLENMR